MSNALTLSDMSPALQKVVGRESPRATSAEEPDAGNPLVRIWRGAGSGNRSAYSTTAFSTDRVRPLVPPSRPPAGALAQGVPVSPRATGRLPNPAPGALRRSHAGREAARSRPAMRLMQPSGTHGGAWREGHSTRRWRRLGRGHRIHLRGHSGEGEGMLNASS